MGIERGTRSWELPSNHLREIKSSPGRLPSFSSCEKVIPLAGSGEKQQKAERITSLLSTTHATARGTISIQTIADTEEAIDRTTPCARPRCGLTPWEEYQRSKHEGNYRIIHNPAANRCHMHSYRRAWTYERRMHRGDAAKSSQPEKMNT